MATAKSKQNTQKKTFHGERAKPKERQEKLVCFIFFFISL